MSPQLALRLAAARPLRGVIITTTTTTTSVGIYARSHLYSTSRPPPRPPRPPPAATPQSPSSSNEGSSTVIELGPPPPSSEASEQTKNPQDASSNASPPPPPPPPPEGQQDSKQSVAKDDPSSPSSSSTQQPSPADSSPRSSQDQTPSSSSSSSSSSPSSEQPDSSTQSESSSGPSSSSSSSSRRDGELPSVTDSRRHALSARFSNLMDNFQSRVLVATQTINDLTGYSAIEAIKARNAQLEEQHSAAQARLREARRQYKSLTQHRASTQREVTTLLARKDTWNPHDLERFTSLYRMDHELEAQVANASSDLTEAEAEEGKLSADLNAGILRRYHEEQIWSDRIRRQSTWGTWGLMGVNFVLFVLLQFVAEPWRRKRMIKGITESEKSMLDEVRQELADVRQALEVANGLREQERESQRLRREEEEEAKQERGETELPSDQVPPAETSPAAAAAGGGAAAAAAAADISEKDYEYYVPRKPWKEMLKEYWEDPALLKEDLADLYSDRRVNLQMRDVSTIALEGAAAGAAVVAAVAITLVRISRS